MPELRNLQNQIMWLHNPTIKGRLLRLEQHLGFETHRKVSQVFQHSDDKIVKLLTRLRDLRVAKETATDAILNDLDIDLAENGKVSLQAVDLEKAQTNHAIVKACAEGIAQLEAVVDQLDKMGICYFGDVSDAVTAAKTDIMDREAALKAVIRSKPQIVGGREAESMEKISKWEEKTKAVETRLAEAKTDLVRKTERRDEINSLLEKATSDISPLLKPMPVDPAVRQAALDLVLRNKPMGDDAEGVLRLKVWEGKKKFAERMLEEAKEDLAARKAAGASTTTS